MNHVRTRTLGIALALVLATAGMGFADNVTPATARSIAMNSTAQDFLESGSRTSVWYKVQLFASRSYQISVWTVREDGVFVNIDPLELYSDAAGTVLVSSGVTTTDGSFEGSPNDANLGSRTTIFQPTAAGVYLIHTGTDTVALAATKVNIRVRETTLFSPWTSRAAGFEGFMEIHNNTSAAVSVTLRAFNSAGALQGAGLTFAVPANATEFKTATQVGVPVGTFAGLVLTHDGAFGAISGNITTLNGANGLSFDSPFTPREFAGGGGSDSSATSGVNSDITSLTGLTTPLSLGQGGTGQTTAVAALTALGGAASGVNTDITSLTGLTTPLSLGQGGTGHTTAGAALTALGGASSGANSNITSLTGLTTPLSLGQGGTGQSTLASNGIVYGQGTGALATAVGVAGQVLTGTAGAPVWTGSPSISGNIGLVSPSTSSTGNIMKGVNRFIHNFGTSNTFIGQNAGNFSMIGIGNTASGANALQGNTTGSGNTASGQSALLSNTTGNFNTATGLSALQGNTTGYSNTATGQGALQSNTTGFNNTASGAGALQNHTTGNDNTASGQGALLSNTTGSNNTASGASALQSNTIGSNNTGSGMSALFNNTTGNGNTASGGFALYSNANGGNNTAIGQSVLQNNTTGSENTASGVLALFTNTTGDRNTASGYYALFSNTTGTRNTASGYYALYNNTNGFDNTASGQGALFNNTTSSNNTASGANALFNNTTGSNNTAFGSGALFTNMTGTSNTAIGFGANVSTSALTNATAIGNGASVNASNKIRLGNAAVTVIEGQVAYTFPSDRTRKENFRNVDDQRVLEKLRELSVTTWNYIGHDPKEFRHYGPMAQDFFAAFGRDELGAIGTETTINSGDITAILMLGLKGLDQQVQKDQRTIEAQGAEIASLKLQMARIVALEESRQALAAELLSLKAQVGRIPSESTSNVNAPRTKGADPTGK